jgi:hypothetical protein
LNDEKCYIFATLKSLKSIVYYLHKTIVLEILSNVWNGTLVIFSASNAGQSSYMISIAMVRRKTIQNAHETHKRSHNVPAN